MEVFQRFLGREPRRVRAEVTGPVLPRLAHELEGGEVLPRVEAQAEVGLVVPEDDVVAGPVLLDEGVLEEEGLLLGAGDDEVQVADAGDEERHHRSGVGPLEIVADAVPEVFRLADVDDLPPVVLHEVDAGARGRRLDLAIERLRRFRSGLVLPFRLHGCRPGGSGNGGRQGGGFHAALLPFSPSHPLTFLPSYPLLTFSPSAPHAAFHRASCFPPACRPARLHRPASPLRTRSPAP